GLRQRSVARASREARHYPDRAVPREPHRSYLRGRPPPATLSSPLDHRAHLCVARELSSPVGSSRTAHVHVLLVILFRRSAPRALLPHAPESPALKILW